MEQINRWIWKRTDLFNSRSQTWLSESSTCEDFQPIGFESRRDDGILSDLVGLVEFRQGRKSCL